jgi:hypothetical protein
MSKITKTLSIIVSILMIGLGLFITAFFPVLSIFFGLWSFLLFIPGGILVYLGIKSLQKDLKKN